jgi:four helix bundle protein
MANSDLKVRTKDYALAIIRLFSELPKRTETQVIGRQCSDRGHQSGHNTARLQEPNPMPTSLAKIEGSLQELEETEYWLELLGESGLFPENSLMTVKKETGELRGIFVSVVRNTKAKSKPPKS